MESAILWYDLQNNKSKGIHFELNLYNICVSNKMVNRERCTLFCYVQDNKVSHVEDKVNEEIVAAVLKYFV